MSPTRREFIKRVGVVLGSLMAARCAWPLRKNTPTPEITCYVPVEPTDSPKTTEQLDQQSAILTAVARGDDVDPEVAQLALIAFHRERLRSCWLRLDWLEEQAQDWSDYEKGEQALEQLKAEHRAALDGLVTASALDAGVATEVQNAFDAAAYHVWRANCGMTCYEPLMMPDYTQSGSTQLVNQADLLADLADDTTVDPETVSRAQSTVERDIAFLNLSSEEEQALYDALTEAAGDAHDFPTFEALELEIAPEAAEAARFLIKLLLEE